MTPSPNPALARIRGGRLKKVLSVLLIAALVVCVIIAAAAYLLLNFSPVPARTSFEIDMTRIRELAGAQGLPVRINALIVGEGEYPSTLVVAGTGFQPRRMTFSTFQVVYADHTVMIDAVHSPEAQAESFPGMPYDLAKYDRMQAALRDSQLILATHEHFDHLNGLAKSPYLAEILPKIRLSAEQIANAGIETGFTPELLEQLQPLTYEKYFQAAPGVVLIKAPGHSKGSQMIYIRLQNGQEYLLAGDVVWSALSVERLSGRSRFISLLTREPIQMHGEQIRALANLLHSEPQLKLVVSHDKEQLERLQQESLLGSSFE